MIILDHPCEILPRKTERGETKMLFNFYGNYRTSKFGKTELTNIG
jgi:hypothetical protein